jgi:hypothetical protein
MERLVNRDDSQLPADDALEAMLARARWPEPSAESTGRLLADWRRVSPRRFTLYIPMTAAAAMLIVGTAVGLTWRGRSTVSTTINPHPAPAVLLGTNPRPALHGDLIPVRAPNALETMLVEARRPVRKIAAKPASEEKLDSRAEQFVKQAEESKSEEELDHLAADIAPRRTFAERFARIAATSDGNRRLAAVRLLARCADVDAIPALLTFYGDRATHDVALPGVARLADAIVLGGLIRNERHRGDRPALVSALFRREPGIAVPIYLSLIKDGFIPNNASGPIDVPRPAMDALFAELNGTRLETRILAARALGQIDGPTTTTRLAEMVEADVNRREALMALAYSNGPEARAYLARARESASLRGAVRSVLLQLKS